MHQLIQMLNKHSEIADYVLQERVTRSAEWFFIQDKLDQSRRKDVRYTTLKLYVDDVAAKTRGHAEITLYPSHSEAEIQKLIEQAVQSARLIRNPIYALPQSTQQILHEPTPVSITQLGLDIIEFMFECQKAESGDLNSFEVFVNSSAITQRTKAGQVVVYSTQDCMVEAIVNAKTQDQEIELFKEFHFGQLDKVQFGRQLKDLYQAAKDRSLAQATPDLQTTDIVLSNENVEALLGVYEDSTNAANLFNRLSNAQLGQAIQKDRIGDAIQLRMVDVLAGSTFNAPVDGDGVLLKSCDVIETGMFTRIWGDARHSAYLDAPVTGQLKNAVYQAGSHSLEDLSKGDHLELLDFSSFVVDTQTGDFSGEIRLGYWHHDTSISPINGGSISGNLFDLHHDLKLSKELQRSNRFEGPLKIRLKQVRVAGIQTH